MTGQARNPLLAAVHTLSVAPGARILVAVSGGPDSMALLDTMVRVAPTYGWLLRVGHVNHGLRGAESDADEVFVREQAAAHALWADVAQVDTAGMARRRHLSIEAAGREARYSALRSMLVAWAGDLIVTGHTADDQLETVLLRLMRGAGTQGLSGIVPATSDLARPFLSVRKQDILAHLRREHIPYRLDGSNLDERYLRNALRHRIVPPLLSLQPALPEIVGRSAGTLRADAELLRAAGEAALRSALLGTRPGALTLSIPVLGAMHPALRRSALGQALSRIGAGLEPDVALFARLHDLLRRGRFEPTALRRDLVATGTGAVLELGSRPAGSRVTGSGMLDAPGCLETEVGVLTAVVVPWDEVADTAVIGPFHALCAAAAVGWPLVVRTRRPGDRLRPAGAPGSRKLQDLLVDRKIPRQARDRLAIVGDARGVLWVPGVARDRRLAAMPPAGPVLHLRFIPR